MWAPEDWFALASRVWCAVECWPESAATELVAAADEAAEATTAAARAWLLWLADEVWLLTNGPDADCCDWPPEWCGEVLVFWAAKCLSTRLIDET